MVPEILFIATIIFGAIAVYLAFKAKENSIESTKEVLKLRMYGVIILYFAFSLHTFGDMLGHYYGEEIALLFESIAHGFIFASFIYFYRTALDAVESSKVYWFK